MEIWLDTANVGLVSSFSDLGVLEGVTTNPSIVASSKMNPEELIQGLLEAQKGWVAVQVLSNDVKAMISQAKKLIALSPRILVKIPVTQSGIRAIYALSQEAIPTLATAIFEPVQALLAFKAGAHYLAPYVGKIADSGKNPFEVLSNIQSMKARYGFQGKVMGAGIRDLGSGLKCMEIGLCAVTLPEKVFVEFTQDYGPAMRALEKFSEDWADFGHIDFLK